MLTRNHLDRFVRLCGLVVFMAVTVACGQPEAEEPNDAPPIVTLAADMPVTVTGGDIQGVPSDSNPDVMAFKGVPYAAPPVGDLRWRPPDPVEVWSGVREASTSGPICVQDGGQDLPQSEDCLFLNVWAPRQTAELLPVMVWIHGGGYTGGSGSTSLYNGTRFAAKGVVLVTINYRLNAFGFLAHPALSVESPHDASGNYGLMDMVASLEWVRDNIEAFGGDPRRVTIFGESAGAGAVMSVMLMPQSKGLFHRAIAQSNWVNGWDRQLSESVGDWSSAEAQGDHLAQALGATGPDTLAMMRASTSAKVSAAARAGSGSPFTRAGYVWSPNADGWTIPDDPFLMYENGRQHDVPLITGMNGNEGSLMTRQMDIDDVASFEAHVQSVYPSVASAALEHYDVTSPSWLYHFTRVPPTDWGSTLGSHHAAELVYVFGTMTPTGTPPAEAPLALSTEGNWSDVDRQLSETMMSYWVNFAATGNPNGEGLPPWAEFDGLTNRHLTLGDTVMEETGLHDEGAALFTTFAKAQRAGR